MLTGRPPFTGTAAERLAKHQTIPTPDVREWRPDCPQSLVDLIERMTAKRPQDRPKSAVELLSQVQRLAPVSDGVSSRKIGRHVVPASDTAVDESCSEVTCENSSLSSDTEIAPLTQLDEFDFTNLQVNDDVVDATNQLQGSVKQFPAQSTVMPFEKNETGCVKELGRVKEKTASLDASSRQALLLGFGLAVAIVALIAVIVVVVHTFMRPEADGLIRLKATESGKKIIVVDQ